MSMSLLTSNEPDVAVIPKRRSPSIYDYVNDKIVHPDIVALDIEGGQWIQCRCRNHRWKLKMKRPFAVCNFLGHILTHPVAMPGQTTITSFFSDSASYHVDPSPTEGQSATICQRRVYHCLDHAMDR